MNKNSKNYPFYAHVESYIQTTNSRLTSDLKFVFIWHLHDKLFEELGYKIDDAVGDLQWNLRKDLAHVKGNVKGKDSKCFDTDVTNSIGTRK